MLNGKTCAKREMETPFDNTFRQSKHELTWLISCFRCYRTTSSVSSPFSLNFFGSWQITRLVSGSWPLLLLLSVCDVVYTWPHCATQLNFSKPVHQSHFLISFLFFALNFNSLCQICSVIILENAAIEQTKQFFTIWPYSSNEKES